MVDCIWKVAEEDRHCEYCSFHGGCVKHPERIDRKERYVYIMSKIIGRDVREKSRERLLVWCRYMIVYQMRLDRDLTTEIGAFLGLDHSTVTYGTDRMIDMLKHPGYYPKEMAIWHKFEEMLSL